MKALILAAVANLASAGPPCLSPVSWGDPRVDLFGVAPDASIWHKFYTGWDWQPFNTFERLPSEVDSNTCPSVTSWGDGRLDIFYINSSDDFGGDSWGPSWETAEDLGGDDLIALSSVSWGDNRLDVVAKVENGSYSPKVWTGEGWYPSETGWENFGGYFFSNPAAVSWGPGRLDIVGLSADTGSLHHMYYQDGWSEWEDMGGGPFIGTPKATSWGPNRLDFWAIDSDGQLNHLYWDGSQYQDWEQLGGEFTDTPQVVHWGEGKIDIVGKDLDDGAFHLKSFDGSKWRPSATEWYELAGPFESEPRLLAKRVTNFLYVFGLAEDGELRMQIWTWYDWQPGHNATWPLGNISSPYSKGGAPVQEKRGQVVLGPLDLWANVVAGFR